MKTRASKLDPHAAALEAQELEGRTLADMAAWLKERGLVCSLSSLSAYLSRARTRRQRALLLAQISSGAQQVKEVEAAFAKNPVAELASIIKLHRVAIMQLSTRAVEDPELLKLTDQLTRTVMDYMAAQTRHELKEKEIALADRRVTLLEQKAAAFDSAKAVMESTLSPEEQRQRLKEILQ